MLTDRAIIDALVDAGELVEWRPPNPRLPLERVVLLRPPPMAWLSEPKGGEQDAAEIIRQETIVALGDFVAGTLLLGDCLKDIGGRSGVCEWKRLAKTPPGMRILGTLAAPDVFVGMKALMRDQLPHRRHPNQGDGVPWRDHIRDCADEHTRLFGKIAPIRLSAAIAIEDEIED
jgi:hypothetical protein